MEIVLSTVIIFTNDIIFNFFRAKSPQRRRQKKPKNAGKICQGKVQIKTNRDGVYVFQIAVEALANIRTVVSLGCERVFLDMYVKDLIPYIKSSRKKAHFRGFMLGLARSLLNFAYAAGLGYGIDLLILKHLTYGDMFK